MKNVEYSLQMCLFDLNCLLKYFNSLPQSGLKSIREQNTQEFKCKIHKNPTAKNPQSQRFAKFQTGFYSQFFLPTFRGCFKNLRPCSSASNTTTDPLDSAFFLLLPLPVCLSFSLSMKIQMEFQGYIYTILKIV